MIIKAIAVILVIIFLLPCGLGLSAGLNRTFKIGISISILGLCLTILADNLYLLFIIPYGEDIEAYEHGFTVRTWLLKGIKLGIVVSVIGASVTYVASVIQAWKKRQTLLPFLFGRGEKG